MEIKVNNDFKEVYSAQYGVESAIWRGISAKQKYSNIVKIAKGQTFKKVLEIGAGDGSILKLMDENNFGEELFALEISESGVAQIKAKEIYKLKSVEIFDGYKLPFNNNEFDLIILSHVLEHVEHERILLREIHRVGKAAIIEVPKDYRFGADKKIKHFLAYGHINLYSPTLLKYLLLTENFKIKGLLTSLYNKESYLYGKNNTIQKAVWNFIYFAKTLLINTPWAYINHKFINTITVLVEPNNQAIKIYQN